MPRAEYAYEDHFNSTAIRTEGTCLLVLDSQAEAGRIQSPSILILMGFEPIIVNGIRSDSGHAGIRQPITENTVP